jgi:predicted nucleic acid-binding protein
VIFIDTGAFLARHLLKDQYHSRAAAYWDVIRKKSETCATSNLVLDETFTLLGRRAGYSFAAERARNIYASGSLIILRSDNEDELKAVGFFEKYSDHSLSFTDCVSFVLMQKRKIKKVFTFDRHFQMMGFQSFPV